MMKVLLVSLSVLFFGLQYKLWLGDRSIRVLKNLEAELVLQLEHNQSLESRNTRVETEIMNLKNGLDAVEERARSELGMIKKDELFYQLIPAY
jgi:cell division protein FtsB